MKLFESYRKVLNAVEKVAKIILGVLVIAMAVLSVTEIIRRYFFSKTWVWSDEVLRYSLAWLAFIGASISYRNGRLSRFDMLESRLGSVGKGVLSILLNTLVLGFAGFLTIKGYLYATSRTLQKQLSMGTKLPMMYFYLCIPIGMALMLLFCIEKYGIIAKKMSSEKKEAPDQ